MAADRCIWPKCGKRIDLPYHVYSKPFGFCEKHWGSWCNLTDAAKDAKVAEWLGPKVHRLGKPVVLVPFVPRLPAAPPAPTTPPAPREPPPKRVVPRRSKPPPPTESGWGALAEALKGR